MKQTSMNVTPRSIIMMMSELQIENFVDRGRIINNVPYERTLRIGSLALMKASNLDQYKQNV